MVHRVSAANTIVRDWFQEPATAIARCAVMTKLERTIRKLVALKNACDMDSVEFAFYERQLRAIRYAPGDEAGGIIEEVDPYWGSYCRPLPAADHPTGKVLQLRSAHRSESPS